MQQLAIAIVRGAALTHQPSARVVVSTARRALLVTCDTQLDRLIQVIAQHGLPILLRITCYSRRSYAGPAAQRYERFFR